MDTDSPNKKTSSKKHEFLELFTQGSGGGAPNESTGNVQSTPPDLGPGLLTARTGLSTFAETLVELGKGDYGNGWKVWLARHGELTGAVDEVEGAVDKVKAAQDLEALVVTIQESATEAAKLLAAYVRWVDVATKLEPRVEKALKRGAGDPEKLRGSWAFAKGKAEAGDPAAAAKSLTAVIKLLGEAESSQTTRVEEETAGMQEVDLTKAQLLTAKWTAAAPKIAQLMEKVPAEGIPARARIDEVWRLANTQAERGIANNGLADLTAALQALAEIKRLVEVALETAVIPQGTVDNAKRLLELDARRKEARALLASTTQASTKVATRLREAFKPKLPDALKDQILKIEGLLTTGDEEDPTKLETAATSAADEIVKLEQIALKPLADKAKWEKELSLFEIRLTTLDNHPLAGNVLVVKPLIKGITDDLALAKDKVAAHDWDNASKDLVGLFTRCDTTEEKADGLAHYEAVRADRVDQLAPLPLEGAIAHDQPKKAVIAARKLLADADLERDAGKYPAGVVLLNKIPEAAGIAQRLVELANAYDIQYPKHTKNVLDLEGLDVKVKAEITSDLAAYKKLVEDADVAKTKDFAASMKVLQNIWGYFNSIAARAVHARDYLAALTAFDLRHTAVKDHEGRIAIEEFYERMNADRLFAVDKATAKEFFTATKILDASKPMQVDQIATAEIGKKYLAKKKTVGEDIVKLEEKPNGTRAATAINDAKTHITAGETAATARQWPAALKSIEEAEKRVAVATKLLKEDKELADLKDTTKLDAIDTDFDAAFDVYEKMLQHVTGKDDGSFTALLAKAAAPAAQAKVEKDKPDFPAARKQLDDAIAICERAILLIPRKSDYDTNRAALKVAHDTTLPGVNDDDCIKTDIESLALLLQEADNLVKADGFDYPAAETKLSDAQRLVVKAERSAAAYKKLKPDAQKIKDTLVYLKHATRKDGVDTEIKRLEKLELAISTAKTGGDLPAAAKAAAEGAKLCDAFKATADAYVKAKNLLDNALLPEKPGIEGAGKEPAEKELDEVTALLTQVDDLFKARAFDASIKVMSAAYGLIQSGKKIIVDHDAYEVERVKADNKIKAVEAVANDGVNAQLEKLRERYTAAVEMAKTRNYKRAKDMVAGIPADGQLLLPIAQAFKDCDDARKAAKGELDKLPNVENAEAIAPLHVHLEGRHESGVKLVAAADYAGAKVLFDEVKKGSEDAIKAAEAHGIAAQVAETVKNLPTGNEQELREAIAKARELRKAIMDEPESLYVVGPMTEAHSLLASATEKVTSNEGEAKKDLAAAVDACAKARIGIGHYKQMEAEMAGTKKAVNDLLGTHAQADFVRADGEQLLADVDAAQYAARSTGSHTKATQALAEIDKKVLALRGVADAQAAYVKLRDELLPHVEKLEKHAHRYAIKTEIEQYRKHLTDAAGKAAARDHTEAMKLLATAQELYDATLVKAKMHADDEPSVDEVKKVLEGSGGPKRLDEVVASLDPKAQRKVLRVALEARFGCKLTVFAGKNKEDLFRTAVKNNPADEDTHRTTHSEPDGNKKGPNIRRFYDLMSNLPDSHTKDNDSMLLFTDVGGPQEGSAYGPSRKEVMMREGAVGKSSVYGVGLGHELEATDVGCEPVDGKDVTFFDWNTLHEVGHALDDKLGFMKNQGEALGGWKHYGGNVLPIAEKVAEHFEFDEDYVAAYMNGVTDPPIPEPDGCDAETWERRRVACRIWVDRARADNDPWQTAASAKLTAIGGTCYQESYKGTWTSYPLAQRSKGVTGYQFRAPGEWFSELYAAFHSGKMNASHPARAWLKDL